MLVPEAAREDRPTFLLHKRGATDGTVLLVEGTDEALAAGLCAPDAAWVYGLDHGRGWMVDGAVIIDLQVVRGRAVVVALDADIWSNRDVWDAGKELAYSCRAEGATSVRFLRVPGRKGLDDVVGKKEAHLRQSFLADLMVLAQDEKFPESRRPPAVKAASEFFDPDLDVIKLAEAVRAKSPAALGGDGRVALYRPDGYYSTKPQLLTGALVELVAGQYRRNIQVDIEQTLVGILNNDGLEIPEFFDTAAAERVQRNARPGDRTATPARPRVPVDRADPSPLGP